MLGAWPHAWSHAVRTYAGPMPDESHEPPPHRPDAPPPTPDGAAPAVVTPAGTSDAVSPAATVPGSTAPAATTPGSTAPAATTPAAAAAVTAPTGMPVPDEDELLRVAEPASVRRAPKFGAFVTAGVLLGALLGFVVALVTGSSVEQDGGPGFISFLDGQGSARLLVALAGATLGALVAGIAAIVADRRSVRRR